MAAFLPNKMPYAARANPDFTSGKLTFSSVSLSFFRRPSNHALFWRSRGGECVDCSDTDSAYLFGLLMIAWVRQHSASLGKHPVADAAPGCNCDAGLRVGLPCLQSKHLASLAHAHHLPYVRCLTAA